MGFSFFYYYNVIDISEINIGRFGEKMQSFLKKVYKKLVYVKNIHYFYIVIELGM